MTNTLRRLSFILALSLSATATLRAQAALFDPAPFADPGILADHLTVLVQTGARVHEIGVNPNREWIVVSTHGASASTGFPLNVFIAVQNYQALGWIVDVVAFTQDGTGGAVIANQPGGLYTFGNLPQGGALVPLVLGILAAGDRVLDLSFTANGYLLVTESGTFHGAAVPNQIWDAMVDMDRTQRRPLQTHIEPNGAWFVVASDWYASRNVTQTCVNAARYFQVQRLRMDCVALCDGGGFILYSNGLYSPSGGYLGQFEYGMDSSSNIWGLMDEYEVPGLSVAYIRNHTIQGVRGYGDLEWNSQRAVYTSDLFDMASVSKGFCAAVILSLTEGATPTLTLETSALEVADAGPFGNPLHEWLYGWDWPILPPLDQNTLNRADEFTLRRLLSHTASLEPWGATKLYPGDTPGTTVDKLRGWSTGDRYRSANRVRFNEDIDRDGTPEEPGTVYRYSGGGFMAAEAMAEVVTGADFRDLVDATLINWMGLEDTSSRGAYVPEFEGRVAVPHSRRTPVDPEDRAIYTWTAAGGIAATPEDMARYVLMLMNFGYDPVNNVQVLSAQIVQEMLTDQTPDGSAYGLGLSLSAAQVTDSNGEFFTHGGSHPGEARTRIAGRPSGGTGIVIAIHAGHQEAEDLRERIYDHFRTYHGW